MQNHEDDVRDRLRDAARARGVQQQSRDRSQHIVVQVDGVSKSYGGAPVLNSIDIELWAGQVIALAGENGAGKSTLLKIIAGQVKADAGRVILSDGTQLEASPRLAYLKGISIVPQELAPVLERPIYENLFLGHELRTRLGLLDRGAMIARAKELLSEFDIDVDPKLLVMNLSLPLQQVVEILKHASFGCKVLLLDEPTSALAAFEVDRLYGIIDKLKMQGVAIAYSTHKMAEIRAVADRVVVLRDGRLVEDSPIADISDDEIVNGLIGRELGQLFPEKRYESVGDVVLRVEQLKATANSAGATFIARRGEIVALAGLAGAGRTEILEAIFGIRPSHGGNVAIEGRAQKRAKPCESIDAQMALVPEDRKVGGIILGMSIFDNCILPNIGEFTRVGFVRRAKARTSVSSAMKRVKLQQKRDSQAVERLSGGNQQKVALGKWLTGPVKILLLDEPTRGVDVGARSEIYKVIIDLAASGMCVVMASSDMLEVLGLAHRVIVVKDGEVVGELSKDEIDKPDAQRRIFQMATHQSTSGNL